MAEDSNQRAVLCIWLSLRNFLPVVGLAWTLGRTVAMPADTMYLSALYDDRQLSLLNQFLDLWEETVAASHAYVYTTKSTFLHVIVNPILNRLPEAEKLDSEMLLVPVPLKSAYLYPDVAVSAIQIYFSVCAKGSIDKLKYVSSVTKTHTSITDNNLVALGVFEPTASGDRPTNFSLSSFFGKAVTMMGKRRFNHGFLRHPAVYPEIVRQNQKIITMMMEDRMLAGMVAQKLSRLTDLDKILLRLVATAGAIPSTSEGTTAVDYLTPAQRRRLLPLMISVYDSLHSLRQLAGLLNGAGETTLTNLVNECVPLINLIHKVFDIEEVKTGGPKVISAVLRQSYREIRELYEELENIDESFATELSRVDSVAGGKAKLVAQKPTEKVLRVPKTVSALPPDAIILKVNKNETIFTTPRIQNLNEAYLSATSRAAAKEDYLIKKSLIVMITYTFPINAMIDWVAQLDILCGVATTLSLLPPTSSGGMPWTCPEIIEDSSVHIEFVEGRHPLLSLRAELCSDAQKCVANNFKAEGVARHYVITGPNMGGKSTYSRQQALLCLMAGYGLLLPCKAARLTLIQTAWARIGANDNPCRNSSTFMVEAQETAEMLSAIRPSSVRLCDAGKCLVVLDELGRGTSVKDGLIFARAIERYLVEHSNVVSLCATHFHELALIDHVRPLQLGLSFGDNRYRVREGIERDSDGVLIAERCGFPEEITRSARALLGVLKL